VKSFLSTKESFKPQRASARRSSKERHHPRMAGRNLRGELMFYNWDNLKGKEERRQVGRLLFIDLKISIV